MATIAPPLSIADRLARTAGVQKVPNRNLDLFMVRDFLDEAACAHIVALIDARRRPSTVADANGDSAYRTSETCELEEDDPVVRMVDERLVALTGLDPRHGEPVQGQRYAVGQEFKDHTDYFEPYGPDYETHCAIPGQRTWTAMMYLNKPEAGGATRFRKIDKIVQPETGKLLLWNNLDPSGRPNPWTLHHGMKVRAGVKYVITKWYRERLWPGR